MDWQLIRYWLKIIGIIILVVGSINFAIHTAVGNIDFFKNNKEIAEHDDNLLKKIMFGIFITIIIIVGTPFIFYIVVLISYPIQLLYKKINNK